MRYDFAMTWANQRRSETPGQERHSGRTAKAFLTLSLLRAHFYTGVFHISYVRSARLTDTTSKLYLSLRHSVPNKGLYPLRCYAAIPAPLWVRNDFSNHFVLTSLKTPTDKGGFMEYKPNPELEKLRTEKSKMKRKSNSSPIKSPDLKIVRSIMRTANTTAARTVSAPSQKLWKVSHRRLRNWTSPRWWSCWNMSFTRRMCKEPFSAWRTPTI